MRLVSVFVLLAACSARTASDVASSRDALGSGSLVIAVVYAGGGNTGATFDRDYVVVVNRSPSPVSLANVSLQYASATGGSALGATDATRTLLPTVALASGAAILVGGAAGASGPSLGASDVVDATPLALSTAGGRLALVSGTESLGCNGDSIPCDAAAAARVIDRVGWGSATWFEGSAAAAVTNDSALVRASRGCTDTDSNADDFEVATPVVRRQSSALEICAVEASDGGVDAGLPDAALVRSEPTIETIQGNAHRSPRDGTVVDHVRGVVTAVGDRRFAMASIAGDGAPSAIWVETPTRVAVGVGSLVEVRATVRERRPDCASCNAASDAFANLTVTTLVASSVVHLGALLLPEPVTIGAGGQAIPNRHGPFASPLDIESRVALDPSQSLDFLERFEGVRVRLHVPRTAGATHGIGGSARELAVVADESLVVRNPRGTVLAPLAGEFGQRLVLVDGMGPSLPMIDAGDSFASDVVGVVDYERGRYVVRVTEWSSAVRRPLATEPAWDVPDAIAFASLNAHNFSTTTPASRVAALAQSIVDDLRSPDVLALEEIQDDDGVTDDGVTSASTTLKRMVDAIVAAGGPRYEAADVAPLDGQDGGQPGANIRPALLVRADGDVRVRRRGEPSATTEARVLSGGSGVYLETSPARIGAADSAFLDGRKPLVVELGSEEGRIFVVVVHLRSRLGDAPRFGRFQPATRSSESVRHAEVDAIASFVRAVRARDVTASIVVMGDFNDESDSAALAPLRDAGLVDAMADVPPDARATYVFDGVGEGLDGIFVSPGLGERILRADVVHAHAEFAYGASDHDPVRVAFTRAHPPHSARGCSVDRRRDPAAGGVATLVGIGVAAWASRRARRRKNALRRASRRCP